MKKKIIIILFSLLVILSIGGFLIYKINDINNKKVLEEKRLIAEKINIINEELALFKENKINEKQDNELVKYFNNIILIHENIHNINVDDINLSEVKKLDNTIDNYQNLLNKINEYKYENLDEIITSYSTEEKQTIKDIYENSEIVKSIDDDLVFNQKNIDKINDNLQILNYLKDNENLYTISNNKIIYTKDSFATEFKKFNSNLVIEKYVDLGKKIPILMYHGVLDKYWGDSSLFVKVAEFDTQMKYLSENGYTSLNISEIANAKNYDKPIIITFDDGYKDVYDYAYPILQKYNLKADVYVISGWLDGKTYMNEDMVKELSDSPLIEIGSHTISHASLGTLNSEEIEKEVFESKETLEKITGTEINSIAYPKGSYGSVAVNISKKYYKYGLTTVKEFNYEKNLKNMTLNRIKIPRGLSLNDFISLL